MTNKKAQTIFGLSFGVIFSIFIIIFIIGAAIYGITHFLSVGNCSRLGLYYEDIQKEIDKAWTSGIYRGAFSSEIDIPSKIDVVCFGNFSAPPLTQQDSFIRDEIEFEISISPNSNIFMYPVRNACEGELAVNALEHVHIPNFFCVENSDGQTPVQLSKEPTSQLVLLEKT